MNLDPAKVERIIRQKEEGALNPEIPGHGRLREEGPVALVCIQAAGEVPSLRRPGRKRVEATDKEKQLIEEAYARYEGQCADTVGRDRRRARHAYTPRPHPCRAPFCG
jgi:hypothetical protein